MTGVWLIFWSEGGCEVTSFSLCHLGVCLMREGENGLMLSIAGVRIALGMDSAL